MHMSLNQVEAVSKKEKTKQRPQALNTVEMLRVASSALGMYTTVFIEGHLLIHKEKTHVIF